MNLASIVCVALVASAGFASANIVTTAQGVPELSTLVAAVQAADLVEALAEPAAPLTVFAPTNDAFAAALKALNLTAEDLLANTDLLSDVLEYHVVRGAAKAADLADGQVLTTLGGGNVTVSIMDGSVFILSAGGAPAKVAMADVEAGDEQGSIVHVIESVLVPEL